MKSKYSRALYSDRRIMLLSSLPFFVFLLNMAFVFYLDRQTPLNTFVLTFLLLFETFIIISFVWGNALVITSENITKKIFFLKIKKIEITNITNIESIKKNDLLKTLQIKTGNKKMTLTNIYENPLCEIRNKIEEYRKAKTMDKCELFDTKHEVPFSEILDDIGFHSSCPEYLGKDIRKPEMRKTAINIAVTVTTLLVLYGAMIFRQIDTAWDNLYMIYVLFWLNLMVSIGLENDSGYIVLKKTEFKFKKIILFNSDIIENYPFYAMIHQLVSYLYMIVGLNVIGVMCWLSDNAGDATRDWDLMFNEFGIFYSVLGLAVFVGFAIERKYEFDKYIEKQYVDSKFFE